MSGPKRCIQKSAVRVSKARTALSLFSAERGLVNDYACTDTEVVLGLTGKGLALDGLVSAEDRVVVELDGANIDSRMNANINAAADTQRKARVAGLEARDADQCIEAGAVHIDSLVSRARQKMCERPDRARVLAVVLDLHTAEEVVDARINVACDHAGGEVVRPVSAGDIELETDVLVHVAGQGQLEAVEAVALVDDVAEVRVVIGEPGVHAVVRVAAVELDLVVFIRPLRKAERRAGQDEGC